MDALFIFEVSKLLKGLLDLLTKSLCLTESGESEEDIKCFWEKAGPEPRNGQQTTDRVSDNIRFNLIPDNQIIRRLSRAPLSHQAGLPASRSNSGWLIRTTKQDEDSRRNFSHFFYQAVELKMEDYEQIEVNGLTSP